MSVERVRFQSHVWSVLMFFKTKDLNEVLKDLASCVELAMKNLYDLQTATINANGGEPRHATYKKIRTMLKEQWEAITTLLKKCRSFGADVQLLRTSLPTASKDDIGDLLEEMQAKCSQYAKIAAELTAGHDGVVAVYFHYRDRFKTDIDHPKSRVDQPSAASPTPPGRYDPANRGLGNSSRHESMSAPLP